MVAVVAGGGGSGVVLVLAVVLVLVVVELVVEITDVFDLVMVENDGLGTETLLVAVISVVGMEVVVRCLVVEVG